MKKNMRAIHHLLQGITGVFSMANGTKKLPLTMQNDKINLAGNHFN